MKSIEKNGILPNWSPPNDWLKIETVDMHTGGEPLRIVSGGLPEIKGTTILKKRMYFKENYDFLRTGLLFEPRGHADMYGAIITEPCTPDGDFGVFFMHNEGYSTMCGHAILALAKFFFETELKKGKTDKRNLLIDAPAGRIVASAKIEDGKVQKTSFLNVPSFVYLKDQLVKINGIGDIKFSVAFGGAFYAICDAEGLGLKLDPSDYQQLIDYGRRIKYAVIQNFEILHPFEKDLSFLYGTILTGKAQNPSHHSRNVCVFADGEVDRSATGTGISARAAFHYLNGEMVKGREYIIESIIGTTMSVKIADTLLFGTHEAVLPEVSGTSYFTGKNTFYFDPDDPLKNGFILR